MSTFSDNLYQARQNTGLSATEFAEKILHKKYSTYKAYENGQRQPQITEMLKLARLLGVSADNLLFSQREYATILLKKLLPEEEALLDIDYNKELYLLKSIDGATYSIPFECIDTITTDVFGENNQKLYAGYRAAIRKELNNQWKKAYINHLTEAIPALIELAANSLGYACAELAAYLNIPSEELSFPAQQKRLIQFLSKIYFTKINPLKNQDFFEKYCSILYKYYFSDDENPGIKNEILIKTLGETERYGHNNQLFIEQSRIDHVEKLIAETYNFKPEQFKQNRLVANELYHSLKKVVFATPIIEGKC